MAGEDGGSRFQGALRLGLAATAAVTAAIAAAGKVENGDACGPFNDTSHILLGEERSNVDGWDPVRTLLGLGLNAASLIAWAVLYRGLFGRPGYPLSLATAGGFVLGAYLLDYYVFPKRFTPGFERRLSRRSIALIYGVLALTFFLADAGESR